MIAWSSLNVDEVASQENHSITVGEDVAPVETDLGFSKFGRGILQQPSNGKQDLFRNRGNCE